MNIQNIFKEVEMICKKERIMEMRYNIDQFDSNDPYFTTSEEMDIKEMISIGLKIDEIIETIKQW